MVSGVETSLIIRANSTISAAGLFPQTDESIPPNRIDGRAAPPPRGVTDASGLTAFSRGDGIGRGDGREGEKNRQFANVGLNGLLAPTGIATVQAENSRSARGTIAGNGASDRAGGPDDPPSQGASAEDAKGVDGLTAEEQEVVEALRQRDAEVRRHEQAHKSVGGQYAGAISYTYQSGPDGRRYAVGGEVPIDASPISGDPEATILKLEQVRRAALAPAEPSSADQAIAARASQGIQQARAELAQQRTEELQAQTAGGETAGGENEEEINPGVGEKTQGNSADAGDGLGDVAPGFRQRQGMDGADAASGAQGEDAVPPRLSPSMIVGLDDFSGSVRQGTDNRPAVPTLNGRASQSPFNVPSLYVNNTLDISI